MASNYLDSYKQTLVADFELQKQLNPALSVPAYIEARKRSDPSFNVSKSALWRWISQQRGLTSHQSNKSKTTWVNDDVALVDSPSTPATLPDSKVIGMVAPKSLPVANLEVKVGAMLFNLHSDADAALFCRIATAMGFNGGPAEA